MELIKQKLEIDLFDELSAELISIYYLQKMNISHYNFENKGLKKLDSWFKKDVFR